MSQTEGVSIIKEWLGKQGLQLLALLTQQNRKHAMMKRVCLKYVIQN